MRVPHLSKAARNRQENPWRLLDKHRLLLRGKHEISISLCLRGQRSKFPPAHTACRQSCMGVRFHPFKAHCDPAKICGGHCITLSPLRGAADRFASRTSEGRVRRCGTCRFFRKKTPHDVAFPHPESRNDHYRYENIPSGCGVLWNLVKGAVDIAENRNAEDEVNPAENCTREASIHRFGGRV